MARTTTEFSCGPGRPCPNFQRLIEYVEPVEEDEAGEGPQPEADLRRSTLSTSTIHESGSSTMGNDQTSSLEIGSHTSLPNPEQLESQAENPVQNIAQQRTEPKPVKPLCRINPNTSSSSTLNSQLDNHLRRVLAPYVGPESDLDRMVQQLMEMADPRNREE